MLVKENNKAVILHDLMLIHQERLSAYEQLIKWIENPGVSLFVQNLIRECRHSLMELRGFMDSDTMDPAGRTETRGDIYDRWPGIKQVVPGCSECDLLKACEENEKATCQVYQKVLSIRGIFCRELRQLFFEQLQRVQNSFLQFHDSHVKPLEPSISADRRSCVMWTQRGVDTLMA